MKKFRVIDVDPPWDASDHLTMSTVKRGARSNYQTIPTPELMKLPVQDLAGDNAVLALWVPSMMLQDGLDVMKAWGFEQKQTHVWVKTKNDPLRHVRLAAIRMAKWILKEDLESLRETSKAWLGSMLKPKYPKETLNDILTCKMGRLFRATHEICLLGTRGSVYSILKDRAQRSVHFGPVSTTHSEKPEDLQERLEVMFPKCRKLEMFARRDRPGWTCVGLECPSTWGEDIQDSLQRLLNE
jgi:N6-adenosine-specific RNA methylase IME4